MCCPRQKLPLTTLCWCYFSFYRTVKVNLDIFLILSMFKRNCSYLWKWNQSTELQSNLMEEKKSQKEEFVRLWHLLLIFLTRYGRVYATAADPYHHSVGPTTTYGVGTMVSWVKHAQLPVNICSRPCSHLAHCFCQQASLYRGGYNRFTPYWPVQLGKTGGGACLMNSGADRLWDLKPLHHNLSSSQTDWCYESCRTH